MIGRPTEKWISRITWRIKKQKEEKFKQQISIVKLSLIVKFIFYQCILNMLNKNGLV